MIKKICEVQSIIDTSPKYKDCLLLPIGLTNGKCNDLSLSCRGKMRNTNAYIISGDLYELENFLVGLLLNACKKYNCDELKITYYHSISNSVSIPFLRELPNIKLVKTLSDYKEFKKEFELLKSTTEERLNEIFQYDDCYARAIRGEKGKFLTGMPQELLIFHLSKYVISDWGSQSQSVHHYISQTLWRAGIYPIIVMEDDDHFPFSYYYGARLWLSSSREPPVELKRGQAYMYIPEDSWCIGSERKEIIDIPYYSEDWVRESIIKIREKCRS